MLIVSEGPLCLKIHLNKYELKKYFDCYNKIHLNSPKTKKIISYLYNTAINSTIFEKNGKRIIEISPALCGGCVLTFTSEPLLPLRNCKNKPKNRTLYVKKSEKKKISYVFAFDDFEYILLVIENLYKNKKTKKYLCSLYSNQNKYFLNIEIPVCDIKTSLFINEFSLYSAYGKNTNIYLKEYTKCLIKDNAIKCLHYYFLKNYL